ncbi:MAG TPA: metal ABC transporter permease [Solirubrobacteraceae bacterium]|nr:metal ABC transporter permease [Solirubrobacteraceae bacterium]
MRHLIVDLYQPFQLGLLQRALVQVVVVSAVAGAVGCFVVIRGLSFTGESLAHTVLPGVVAAYALGISLLLGAAALAAVTVAVALLSGRDRRISDDTAMGVAFAGLFPLGVILLALQSNPTRSLSDFLFGDVLANSAGDVRATIAIALLILLALAAGYRALLACSFDRPYAAALGYRLGMADALLLGLVAATVVIAMLAVGNVLALALLVAPAATARLVLGRLVPMMVLAGALGALSGVVALELSYWAGLAAGAAVVLCAAAQFTLALVASEIRGALLARRQPA